MTWIGSLFFLHITTHMVKLIYGHNCYSGAQTFQLLQTCLASGQCSMVLASVVRCLLCECKIPAGGSKYEDHLVVSNFSILMICMTPLKCYRSGIT